MTEHDLCKSCHNYRVLMRSDLCQSCYEDYLMAVRA